MVMRHSRRILMSGAAVAALLIPANVSAERSTVSTAFSLNGAPGLVELPTAEVAPDSTFSVTYGTFGPMSRGTMSFQITPRLSGSFRYSGVDDLFSDAPGEDGVYHDRNFDLRFRLIDEGQYMPAVSIGLNDFLGTGIYSSEYIVATKSIGPRLRVTGGIGWGRLGSLDPIGSTGTRPANDVGEGGKPNWNQWFRGDFAPFGGISYAVTDKLTFKAEYSSDAYALEEVEGIYTRKSPFNFGLDYQVTDGLNVAAYYLYGNTVGASVTLMMNPRKPTSFSGVEEAPQSVRPRPSRASDPQAWSTDWITDPEARPGIQEALAEALAREGQILEAMSLTATRAELHVNNTRFNSPAQAIGRTARILTRGLPASVETFVIVPVENGVPLSAVVLKRSDLEALEHAPSSDIYNRAVITDVFSLEGDAPDPVATPGLYPRFTWSLTPYTVIGLFGADTSVAGELGLRLGASYEFTPGLILSGAVTKRVVGNLHNDPWVSDSVLPHVRSDIAEYHREGDPSIEHLTLAWYGRPGRDIYSRVTVGYLETMFAGISGEVLWKPVDSRLALGAELNYVQQRDFDQLFGLQDYSVVTGHVSAYYDLGNGFEAQLDVGRYLAGDVGATLSVDRTFANGWKVGAYATLTDVSAEEFGEGSFDKGIRLSIPLEWALGTPSRTRTNTDIRSLSRDGGSRLDVDGRLFDWVNEGHGDVLADRWGRFWR